MTPRRPLAERCERLYRATLNRLGAEALVREALGGGPGPQAVRLLAVGKAAAPMARGALEVLGPRVLDALAVIPHGAVLEGLAGVRVLRGGHPRPTAGSVAAGDALLRWADDGGGPSRRVLVLLSGGASALAVAPADGVTAEEKSEAVAALMAAGAPIDALNALRKHLSRLKGGQLALRLAPAAVEVLVLSDVPGDDLSVVGSGPFIGDPTTYSSALEAVDRAGARLGERVREVLLEGARGGRPETPKPGDPRLRAVRHRLLAGPVDLARTAAALARAEGFDAEALEAPLVGSVDEVVQRVSELSRARAGGAPWLLAMGGEPTIALPKSAPAPDGGRAQHLALQAALAIAGRRACVLAAGSDGRDGPTEQAGAVVDGATVADAAVLGVDLEAALAEARSGPAAVRCGAAIARFESPTHLGDLVIVAGAPSG